MQTLEMDSRLGNLLSLKKENGKTFCAIVMYFGDCDFELSLSRFMYTYLRNTLKKFQINAASRVR